jgi:hypothetical protein
VPEWLDEGSSFYPALPGGVKYYETYSKYGIIFSSVDFDRVRDYANRAKRDGAAGIR